MDRLEARLSQSYLRVRGHSIAWVPPLLLLVAIVFVDWNTSGEFRTISWLVVVPAIAAAVCSVWTTAAYAVLAVATYFVIDNGWAREYQAGVPDFILVAMGGALATAACWVRVREESRMRHMRDIIETTRRTVLRPLPSRWYGLDHAAIYLTAESEALVGGDFYDIQPSPHGPRLLVGDVQGKGLGAVAVASVLLGSFRESGYHEPDLATVAERLEIRMRRHRAHMALIEAARGRVGAYGGAHDTAYDGTYDSTYDPAYDSAYTDDTMGGIDVAERGAVESGGNVIETDAALDSERFATAVLIGFPPPDHDADTDADDDRDGSADGGSEDGGSEDGEPGVYIDIVNFGHEPPLAVGPDGVRELPAGDGLPIGLGDLAGGPPPPQRFRLGRGETLLLVTDGVTEARDASGEFFRLREEIAAALVDDPRVAEPSRLVRLVQDATLRHTGGYLADDTTVFAVRPTTP
ncbi:PP2C family protein-serine/threonine phosphatase [Streptomyces jeddahensis]|uniref:Stage II sporulation protein E (SpoIIE) n=1 Tax=Streptomyces jeddahensis TaxID=1716141 RepID=A0A177HVB4_9ACTN|nr:PP2C family protein-serine/threonine phosphatase [Streptomyces jeddahensis]OAH14881.1 stage II sporulation protein E (SpoIIE) [Streptomyces jeddahensis]